MLPCFQFKALITDYFMN